MSDETRGMSVGEALEVARQRGLIVREGRPIGEALAASAPAAGNRPKREKPALVEASFTALPTPCWTVPLHVTAGDNQRGSKAKIGRAGYERRVVSRCLGGATLKYLAPFADLASRGEPVTVTLTRLGGTGLDPFDGLPASLKWVADTVALMLGFDDSAKSPVKFAPPKQEPGGAHGVRIQLSTGGVSRE
jgi:hypothetical protein